MWKRGCALIGAAVVVVATAVPAAAREQRAGPVSVGTGGTVVSNTAQSTQAGLDALRSGGNAADAAVAVAATLGVTDPYVAGIGGGGYVQYYDARTKRVSTIDAKDSAPESARPDQFIDKKTGKPVSQDVAKNGGLAVGVPGNLATWQDMLK